MQVQITNENIQQYSIYYVLNYVIFKIKMKRLFVKSIKTRLHQKQITQIILKNLLTSYELDKGFKKCNKIYSEF